MADLVGQTFAGCEIIAELGRGGFGSVYKARQIELNRLAAIKILSRDLSEDPEYVSRFKREAAAAGSLSHVNIVQVYAAGTFENVHYFVMEFVDGETLQRRIERHGKLAPTEALAICVHVAEALDYAWKRANLIHRDIKPDNIFLSKSGDVKLGDLGLAKVAGASTGLTRTGTMMGTPNFISPEQAQAKKEIDFRADIYSLGCTLYYMVTGRLPYEGAGDALAIIAKHVHEPPPAIFKVWPDCPMPLARLVGTMVAKRPHERFQSYEELIAEMRRVYALLEEAASVAAQAQSRPAAPVQAPSPPRPATPHVTVQRRFSPALLYGVVAAVSAAVVVGVLVWSAWKTRNADTLVRDVSAQHNSADKSVRVTAGGTPALPGKPYVTTTGIEMLWIPPGEFLMGSTKEEQAWAVANGRKEEEVKREGEAPRKTAIKEGFWLGRTEVTVSQWKEFVAATRYQSDAEKRGTAWCYDQAMKTYTNMVGKSWMDPNFGAAPEDNHPVSCISWNDAVAFCGWLTGLERRAGRLPAAQEVRLPTEAEWEYACRAGSETKFWWGESKEDGMGRLNWSGTADGFQWVSPVDHYGERGRNGFGLADMLGNVYEWCLDEYDAKQAHEECYKGNPGARVLRGGSFNNIPAGCRCAHRYGGNPSDSHSGFGFRVCVGGVR